MRAVGRLLQGLSRENRLHQDGYSGGRAGGDPRDEFPSGEVYESQDGGGVLALWVETVRVGAKEFLRLLNGHGYNLYNADERKGRIEPADIETLVSTYDPEQEVEHTNLLCEKGAKRRESLSP